jgi:hypothetical protein
MGDLTDAKIRNATPGDKLFSAAAKHRVEKSENRMARSAAACSRRCHSALIPSAADGSMHPLHCRLRDTTTFPVAHSSRSDRACEFGQGFRACGRGSAASRSLKILRWPIARQSERFVIDRRHLFLQGN